VQVVGKIERWRFETVVRIEPGFGDTMCGEWTTSGSYLLLDSYPQHEGGFPMRENDQQGLWLGGSSFLCNKLVNH
jgi:hypothetical protein